MSSAWMLTLIFVLPPPDQPQSPAAAESDQRALSVVTAASEARVRGKDELREAYRAAIRKTAKREEFVPEAVAPELLMLYVEIAQADGMAHSEKTRLHGGLKVRLEQVRDRLIRDNIRRQRDLKQAGNRRSRSPRAGANGGADVESTVELAGGEIARANELIDLIQNTIAPDTWNVNGGKGSIYYFGLLKVLVVRQTGEVHHQVGNVLGNLRD